MNTTRSSIRFAVPLVLAASFAGGCIPSIQPQDHTPAAVVQDLAYETMDDVDAPSATPPHDGVAQHQQEAPRREARVAHEGVSGLWTGQSPGNAIRIEILPEEADQQREQQALELNAGGSGFDVLGVDVVGTGKYSDNEWLAERDDATGTSFAGFTDDHEPNDGLYEIWEWQDGELVTLDSVETFLD